MGRIRSKEVAEQIASSGKLRIKTPAQNWKVYTQEPGPEGRGNPEPCYDCSACQQGDHQRCEQMELIMCRCWRGKHKNPPNGRVRTPVKTKKPAPVVEEIEDDDIEWEDA